MAEDNKDRTLRQIIRRHPRAWWMSAVVAVFVMFICHIERQCPIAFPGGPSWPQYYDMFNVWRNGLSDTLPEEVLPIEVNFARDPLPAYVHGRPIPVGTNPVTSRHKLLDLLTKLKNTGCYRYIMLDVAFPADVEPTEVDSALFHTIAEMPRIVIPRSHSVELADSILLPKSCYSEYDFTLLENNFVKYPLIRNGRPSIALRMYEELTGDSVTIHNSLLNTLRGRIFDGSLTLHFQSWLRNESLLPQVDLRHKNDEIPLADSDFEKTTQASETKTVDDRVYYLDDIFESYDEDMIADISADKIVIIGGLTDGDSHATYSGDLSGALINYNAFKAIENGQPRVSYLYLLTTFIIFYLIWFSLQCNLSMSWIYRRARALTGYRQKKSQPTDPADPRLAALIARQLSNILLLRALITSWIGIPAVLSVCSLLTYWIFGADLFNVFWPTVCFNAFYLLLAVYRWVTTSRQIKKIISHQNKSDHATDNNDADDSDISPDTQRTE